MNESGRCGFEEVRKTLSEAYFSNWNFSAWIDFRHFKDIHFSEVLADLVKSANEADPIWPAGFVGAQAPSPWGGYDYGLLSESWEANLYQVFPFQEYKN